MSAATYVKSLGLFAGELATTIATILRDVSLEAGIEWEAVVGPTTRRSITRARRAVAIALRAIDVGNGERLTLTEIGMVMGGKDHTSVLYYLGRKGSYVPVAARSGA